MTDAVGPSTIKSVSAERRNKAMARELSPADKDTSLL